MDGQRRAAAGGLDVLALGWQSQGIGSALMVPILERCDCEGVRAYLEVTSERNKRLYERLGFEVEEPFAPSGGHPSGRCGASQPRLGSDR